MHMSGEDMTDPVFVQQFQQRLAALKRDVSVIVRFIGRFGKERMMQENDRVGKP